MGEREALGRAWHDYGMHGLVTDISEASGVMAYGIENVLLIPRYQSAARA